MPEKIRKLDQQRHELKALRYLLDNHPESMQNRDESAEPRGFPDRGKPTDF